MAPIRYYHVVNRDGRWHLYFGNSFSPLLVDSDRRRVIDAARKLARQSGMKIVIHKSPEASPPAEEGPKAAERDDDGHGPAPSDDS
jgi:hypothetical protein